MLNIKLILPLGIALLRALSELAKTGTETAHSLAVLMLALAVLREVTKRLLQ